MITADALLERMTPEQRLLLRAVLLDGAPARAAWDEWTVAVDIDVVDGYSQRLLPLLARRLPDLAPDDPVRALVRGIYRHSWVRNQLLWRNAMPVLEALRATDAPVLLLKGAALLQAYGGDWGARPMYDIDVLVPPAHAGVALDVLAARGWVPEQDTTFDWVRWRALPRRHAWGFLHEDEGALDLHWHIFSGSVGPKADDAFWRDARPLQLPGLETTALSAPDALLHLIVHGTDSGDTTPPVQWVADAVLSMRREPPEEYAERFVRRARGIHALQTVRAALETITDLLEEPGAAVLLRQVEQAHPTRVERVASREHSDANTGRAITQVRRFAAGGTSAARGAGALTADRLDLGLATRRRAALVYGLSGRNPIVARAARRRTGTFVRVPAAPAPEVTPGVALDFTDPVTLDRHGGPGWGRTGPDGSTTRSGEARLVLPLPAAARGADLTARLVLRGNPEPRTIEVFANEHRVARALVDTAPSTLTFVIPSAVAERFQPFELTIRAAPRGALRRRGRVGVALLEVELGPTGTDPEPGRSS